jgi:hypothetical protein
LRVVERQHPAVRGRYRLVDQWPEESAVGVVRLRRIRAERAVGALRAVGGEGIEGLLESGSLGDGFLDGAPTAR